MMITLFTDFGFGGPYVGQMRAVLAHAAPGVPVIELMSDAPPFDPASSAHLIPAVTGRLPEGTITVAVIDPGVGTARGALVVEADGKTFIGPDNGLLELVRRRARDLRVWTIDHRPETLSATFHGRDLFAPTAAALATGRRPALTEIDPTARSRPEMPDDLERIVYVDVYGNAFTGIRATSLDPAAVLLAAGRRVRKARTFSDLPVGEPLWYENSCGLVEIAVNRGRADRVLGLSIGSVIGVA